MLVGIHYKVKWHLKDTKEVASSHDNVYTCFEDGSVEETITLTLHEVLEKVEKYYPEQKYNTRIEIKAVVVNHVPESVEGYEPILFGDQTEIDEDTKVWGY